MHKRQRSSNIGVSSAAPASGSSQQIQMIAAVSRSGRKSSYASASVSAEKKSEKAAIE